MQWCRATLSRLHGLGTPAATVALLRDAPRGIEVLLLRKAKKMRFGGFWVFPGGGFDADDHVAHGDGSLDVVSTAANAVVREALEEASVPVERGSLVLLSHWLPPPSEAKKRGKSFSTFFFAGLVDEGTDQPSSSARRVEVDGGEIVEHVWLRPEEALDHHAVGRLGLLPPTWMTLDTLLRCEQSMPEMATADLTLRRLGELPPSSFETRSASLPDGRMCYLFEGDAGWPTSEPSAPGPRLRLITSHRSASASPERELSPADGKTPILALERTLS